MSADEPTPHNNGAVHTVVQITKTVMSSATEAELGGLYTIHHEAVPMRHLLNEPGQKQPPMYLPQYKLIPPLPYALARSSQKHDSTEAHTSHGPCDSTDYVIGKIKINFEHTKWYAQ